MEQFNYEGLTPLSMEEMGEVEGGSDTLIKLAVAAFTALAVIAAENWHDVREGWYDGVHGLPPRHQTKPAGK